jgi:hypothetical protein
MLDKLLIKLFTEKDDIMMTNLELHSLCRYCIHEKDMISLKQFLNRCVPKVAMNTLLEVLKDHINIFTNDHEEYILYYLKKIESYVENDESFDRYLLLENLVKLSCKINSGKILEYVFIQPISGEDVDGIVDGILEADHISFLKKFTENESIPDFCDVYYLALVNDSYKCFEWLLEDLCFDKRIVSAKNHPYDLEFTSILRDSISGCRFDFFKMLLNKTSILFYKNDEDIILNCVVCILEENSNFVEGLKYLEEINLIIEKFPDEVIEECLKNEDSMKYLDYFINKGCEYNKEWFENCFLEYANLECIKFSMNLLNIDNVSISNMISLSKYDKYDLFKNMVDDDLIYNVYCDEMFQYLYDYTVYKESFKKEFRENKIWWTNFYLWCPKHLHPKHLKLNTKYIKDIKENVKSILDEVNSVNEKQIINIVQNYVSDY